MFEVFLILWICFKNNNPLNLLQEYLNPLNLLQEYKSFEFASRKGYVSNLSLKSMIFCHHKSFLSFNNFYSEKLNSSMFIYVKIHLWCQVSDNHTIKTTIRNRFHLCGQSAFFGPRDFFFAPPESLCPQLLQQLATGPTTAQTKA